MASINKSGEHPREMEVPLTVPNDVYHILRFIGVVDGTSGPAVVNQLIFNGIRARKATNPDIREFAHRRF